MDYVTRQFINLTKKFRTELRKSIADLRNALNKQTEAIRESNQRADIQQSVPPEIVTAVNLPESIEIHQRETDAREERHYRGRTLLVAWATFIAIAVYAVLVYFQYREMINATGSSQQAVGEARRNRLQAEKYLNATIEQFRLDQRAWVAVVQTSGKPEINKPFDIAVLVRNTGKTFAKDFKMVLVVEPVKKGQQPEFAKNQASFSRVTKSVSILTPSADYTATSSPIKNGNILADTAFKEIVNGDIVVFAYGRLTYKDVFGCSHWTDFCSRLSPDSRWESCSVHNDADTESCRVNQ
jgi:hypothetical protein